MSGAPRLGRCRALGALAGMVLAFTAGAAHASAERGAPPPDAFDYLYAEPNSGAASGGHVALRIGEHVYHFQQVEGGALRLFRLDAARFDHSYRALGNRTLTATHVVVGEDAAEELRWAFERYRQRQDAEFDVLDERRRDRALLASFGGGAPWAIEASGYFDGGEATTDEASDDATRAGLAALRRVSARIEEARGAGYLARRAAELATAVEHLGDDPEALGPGVARRYTDLASEWLAVELLRAPAPLAPGSWVSLDAPGWTLDADERTRLGAIANAIADAAVSLAGSSRPDRGFPMLVALARLEALERCVSSGRWVLLDPSRGDEDVVPAAEVRSNEAPLRRILAERGEDFRLAREALLAPDSWDEGRLSRLELASAAWAALDDALRRGAPLPVPTALQVPSRIVGARALPRPALAAEGARAARERAARAESDWLATLRQRNPYDLVTRNCVTELFTVLASVPLAAHVDPAGPLHFVPLAGSRAVQSAYARSPSELLPSYRVRALDALARCDGSALAAGLRESSTVTARSYAPNDADPLFLFFTDEAAPVRPLLGALNLAVGVGGTVAGALAVPWDGGTLLRRGWEGVIFSVPELAFVSLRRGTIPFAPVSWESDLAAMCAAPPVS